MVLLPEVMVVTTPKMVVLPSVEVMVLPPDVMVVTTASVVAGIDEGPLPLWDEVSRDTWLGRQRFDLQQYQWQHQ